MKKFFGILSLALALTFTIASCGSESTDAPTEVKKDKCCKDSTKTCYAKDSTSTGQEKKCCKSKTDSAKTCHTTDSATCAKTKVDCIEKCGSDSICKAKCKANKAS